MKEEEVQRIRGLVDNESLLEELSGPDKNLISRWFEESLEWLRQKYLIPGESEKATTSILQGMITLVNGHTDVADILADQDPRMLETILMDPLASMANRMNCFKLLTCLLKSASIERSDRLVDAMKARKFTNYVLSNSELCEEQIKTVYYMPIALMCLANELYLVKVPGKEFCHTKDGRRVISTCYELLRKHGKRDGLCQHGTVVMGMVCDIVNEWWWFYLESIDLSEPSGKVFEAMMIYMDFTHSVENLRGSYKRKMLDTMKAIHEHINFGAIRHVQQEIADRNAQALLRELEEVAQRARPSRPKKKKRPKKKPYLDLDDDDETEIVVTLAPSIFITEECVMCLDTEPSVLFPSCMHQVCCGPCAERIRTVCASLAACPYCRHPI